MNTIDEYLKGEFGDTDLFFITPDVKRGLGLEFLPRYHIICSGPDPFITVLRNQGVKIFCLDEHLTTDVMLLNNSGHILRQSLVQDYIRRHSVSTPHILVFKPSRIVESASKEKGYHLLVNPYGLNEMFEDKISALKILQDAVADHILPSRIGRMRKLVFRSLVKQFSLPFVVQFGKGWAGRTTFFIDSEDEWNVVQKKFSHTEVRACPKISGRSYLTNAVVYKKQVISSPPASQISGIPSLSPNPAATCGRQWPAAGLSVHQTKIIEELTVKLGLMMANQGYQGYFGVDFMVDINSGTVYVSEINARFTASSGFYSYLERHEGMIPLFAYHLGEFLGKNLPIQKRSPRIKGAQIIIRMPIAYQYEGKIFQISADRTATFGYPRALWEKKGIFSGRFKIGLKPGEETGRIETCKPVLLTPEELRPEIAESVDKLRSDQVNPHEDYAR